MALEKELVTNSGVNATYHRIVSIAIDTVNNRANIAVGEYLSQVARLDGKQPLNILSYQTTTDAFRNTNSAFVVAYDYLKSLPDFAGALDA